MNSSRCPVFDQNAYIATSDFDDWPLSALAEEFAVVREAKLTELRRLNLKDWDRTGTASGHPVSVRALAFMMVGHVRHHVRMLKERDEIVGGR